MIKHDVLMALTEEITPADETLMHELVDAIRADVGEVRSYELVRNVAPGARYNWAILSTFDSTDDIDAYKVHPLHQKLVACTDPYTTDFVTLDYEIA